MARAIRAGKKSRHTIPAKGVCRWKPGRVYAIEVPETDERPRHTVGHITITVEPREEQLTVMTLRDARKEGYRTSRDFWDAWQDEHGFWSYGMKVWILTFELGDLRDRPRLLKARPGGEQYTTTSSLALKGSAEEVSEAYQAMYAENGRLSHDDGLSERRKRLQEALAEIRRHPASPATNARLREAERRIRQSADPLVYDLPSTG